MKKHILSILIVLFALPVLAAPAPGQWQQGREANLNFWIYIPAKRLSSTGLMLNLHGCAQRAQVLKEHGNWKNAADQYGLVVVIPDVPDGGVIAGCWDYYGADHAPNRRHSAPLIALTQKLLKHPDLRIDSERVYVSGLSSGAGQAMVLGCMRPDLYRGVGLNAGPALGTGPNDLRRPGITPRQVADICTRLAGANAGALATQLSSVIVGDQDYIVNPQHSSIIVEALAALYEAKSRSDLDLTKLKGPNTKGQGFLFRDARSVPRLSVIVNNGLGHAWPAGNGAGGFKATPFVNANSVDYPDFLGRFFTQAARIQDLRRDLRHGARRM